MILGPHRRAHVLKTQNSKPFPYFYPPKAFTYFLPFQSTIDLYWWSENNWELNRKSWLFKKVYTNDLHYWLCWEKWDQIYLPASNNWKARKKIFLAIENDLVPGSTWLSPKRIKNKWDSLQATVQRRWTQVKLMVLLS